MIFSSSAIRAETTHGRRHRYLTRRPLLLVWDERRAGRRLPRGRASGRASRRVLPPRARGSVGDAGPALGGWGGGGRGTGGGELLALRDRPGRRSRRADPPSRRAPDFGRVLFGRPP